MKDIKKIANEIIKLEKLGTDEAYRQIERIASTLSLEEMLEIDEYIITKNFLD